MHTNDPLVQSANYWKIYKFKTEKSSNLYTAYGCLVWLDSLVPQPTCSWKWHPDTCQLGNPTRTRARGKNVLITFPTQVVCNQNSILPFQMKREKLVFKGILHQKIFYCLNLIFWIIMGCGIARFGRKGLKTTETWKFWSQILSPGVLRRGAPGVSRHSTMGFRGAAQGFRGTARWGFEAQHHGVSRGSNTDKTLQWFIISRCPSRSLVIRWCWQMAPPLETPWRCASKPQVRRASKPLGTNFETKIFKFRWFLGPSD